MRTQYPRILAASAVVSLLALPGAAQNLENNPAVIDIEVAVQDIAVLTVVTQTASAVLNDPDPTVVGVASPLWPPAGMAQLELATNFCVGLQFSFDTVTAIRPNPTRYYGQALGQSSGNTLGVLPFVRAEGHVSFFGNPATMTGPSSAAPLMLSKSSTGFCNGYFDIYLGAVTQWNLTMVPEPVFAAPDTYVIPITATIVP